MKNVTGVELPFPPFGYVLTVDSLPPDYRLTEITQFARSVVDEMKSVSLTLSVLPTHSAVLGDYRIFKDMDIQLNAPNVMFDFRQSYMPDPKNS